MIVAGLTGSIGMGKSTTAEMFRDLEIPVFDSDATVHDLYNSEGVKPVGLVFPSAVVEGKIDREKLSKEVVGDPEAFRKLEEIIHPLVRERELKFRKHAAAAGNKLAILDIPLLFETGRESAVDFIIVVSAPLEEQRKRVMSRPGMTEQKFKSILARQVPDTEKRRRADFVIDTGKGLLHAKAQVAELVKELLKAK